MPNNVDEAMPDNVESDTRTIPATLERSNALEWLEASLRHPRPGVATVVFHSIVLLYLSGKEREQIASLLAEAGERASVQAPLAWVSMEPGDNQTDVTLTLWPGGERKLIATAGYHGRPVTIFSDPQVLLFPGQHDDHDQH
jgi:hypothetical protein